MFAFLFIVIFIMSFVFYIVGNVKRNLILQRWGWILMLLWFIVLIGVPRLLPSINFVRREKDNVLLYKKYWKTFSLKERKKKIKIVKRYNEELKEIKKLNGSIWFDNLYRDKEIKNFKFVKIKL